MSSTTLTPADRAVLGGVRAALEAVADEQLRVRGLRSFREPVRPFGVRVATVRTIAERALAALEPRDVERVWRLCDALGCSGWLEESYVAGYWAQAMADAYRPADVHVFGRWLDSWVDNWATCDALCCESVGRLLESAPQVASTVAAWAASPNRWVRRGAAVSFVRPARRGLHLGTVLRVADALLEDRDDLVRKGYGWMLKSASHAHPDEVFAYLMARRHVMPRVAFRYALESMDPERRDRAMGRAPR
jgi:3-methyladenine DNA glycosylase AlkD